MRFNCYCIAAAVFFAGIAVSAASERVNLLPDGSFEPVRMNGNITAIKGWTIYDLPRRTYINKYKKYLSGIGLFNLSEEEGTVKIQFPEKLSSVYTEFKLPLRLESPYGEILPPCKYFHLTGKYKMTGGRAEFSNGLKLAPSAEWKQIDFKGNFPVRLDLYPAPGATYTFAELNISAEYGDNGTIALPSGGTLSKILISKNASFKERRGISMWQGWLYKLTGKALAVEQADKVVPTQGAMVLLENPEMSESWKIRVDKDGIVLTCKDLLFAVPALMDYLRKELGFTKYSDYTYYGLSAEKGPADKSVRQLAGCNRSVKLKLGIISSEAHPTCFNGGVHRNQFFANTMVDAFHMYSAAPYHILNVLLPMEKYFKDHPEYFMQDSGGNRVVYYDPGLNHPCYSNPEVAKIMIENLVEYGNAQLPGRSILNFNSGDSSENCYCKDCSKIDSAVEMNKILERAAARLRPGQYLARSAYSSRRTPPAKRHPKMMLHYCLDLGANPCTLHVDCELNRPMIEEIKQWSIAAGDKAFFGFSTYRDRRPVYHLKQIEMLSQYGSQSLHCFVWHGYSPAIPFVTGRWNMGEDPEKLVHEFDHVYFGKGGPAMHKITLLVEKFASEYKHSEEEIKNSGNKHICIFGGATTSATVLDRKMFDQIYTLFDEALKAENDKTVRDRIELEKIRYLAEDLNKYNRISCKTDRELEGFIRRLQEFISIARRISYKLEPVWIGVPGRSFIMSVSGITVSNTGKAWWEEAEIDNIMKNPQQMFIAGAERIPSGWYFYPTALKGNVFAKEYSYNCPARVGIALSRPSLGNSEVTAVLELKQNIETPTLLSIEGLDDDKPGKSLYKITVNGKVIYSGKADFPEKEWGRMGFTVPGGILKAGKNHIVISNITPDIPSRSTRFSKASDGAGDAQWGWVMISEVYLHDPSGDFQDFINDKKNAFWSPSLSGTPKGIIKKSNGKVEFIGKGGKHTGVIFSSSQIYPKPAMRRGDIVRITVKASGNGELLIGCYGYNYGRKNGAQVIPVLGYDKKWSPLRWGWGGYIEKKFPLTASEKQYSVDFSQIHNFRAIAPLIAVTGSGTSVITDVKVEIITKAAR